MNCPIDGTELRITDRQGVEIDYCPKCRGIWLDRGELDKILDREGGVEDETGEEETDSGLFRHKDRGHRRYSRRSFLGELFDFD